MRVIAFVAIAVSALAHVALADGSPLHNKVSVEYRHIRLADALKDLGNKAGVRFIWAEGLLDDADPVDYEGKEQEAGRVAVRLLRPRGLALEQTERSPIAVVKLHPFDEFRVKRQGPFEFAEKPTVTRQGDKVAIAFETKAFCDVTIAIEDTSGRIIRHLVSGVLGQNAPEPFQWNTRKQTIVWDGKTDKGEYVDDKDAAVVRVSLGLAPRYEKNLYWEPKKRVARGALLHNYTQDMLVAAAPEGVYVFDGNGVDHVRLFDHEGNYVRTLYPFPAERLNAVKGLMWRDYPQGYARPAKQPPNQSTFLVSGETTAGMCRGPAAFAMAASGDRLALAKLSLTRIATDGSSGGLNLNGPKTAILPVRRGTKDPTSQVPCVPYTAAFSPDGKRLYLAGYRCWDQSRRIWLSGMTVMDYDGDAEPRPFAGELKADDGLTPGVACDSKGNVYLTDYAGDRILVHDPAGKLIKTIPAKKPVLLAVHPRTGELYVFSGCLGAGHQRNAEGKPFGESEWPKDRFPKLLPATLTVMGPMDNPAVRATYPLPLVRQDSGYIEIHSDFRAAVDFWTEPPTIWLVPRGPESHDYSSGGTPWETCNILLLQPKDGQLVVRRDFGKETAESVIRTWTGHAMGNQFLYVNPATGRLWVAEKDVGGRPGSRFRELLEIDPDDGSIKAVKLPQPKQYSMAEDMAFDIDGHIYLRYKQGLYDDQLLVRYELPRWREVPWDYGEERKGLQSALVLPCHGTVCDDESGLGIAPNGSVAVACSNRGPGKEMIQTRAKLGEDGTRYMYRAQAYAEARESGRGYFPDMFPGRVNMSLTPCLHIWDRHGKVLHQDAVPGMPQSEGVAMDASGNLYVLADPARMLDGKEYLNPLTGTLVKVRPGRNKWISTGRAVVPLGEKERPKRPPDVFGGYMGQMWVQGAEWFYGGVGKDEFNGGAGTCHCWSRSRFALDYFARSFAPEMDQFSVAVLDTNGNLITRIGRYGNVDDGKPLESAGAPPGARSIGGDEVALMHPLHVATHSDRRVFIGDTGNARIVGVRLAYHCEEKIALKDVPEAK